MAKAHTINERSQNNHILMLTESWKDPSEIGM